MGNLIIQHTFKHSLHNDVLVFYEVKESAYNILMSQSVLPLQNKQNNSDLTNIFCCVSAIQIDEKTSAYHLKIYFCAMTKSLCCFMVFLSIESLCYCVGTGGTNTQRICDFLALSFMFSKFCPLITARDICDLLFDIGCTWRNTQNWIWRRIRITLPRFQDLFTTHTCTSIRWCKSWEILIFSYCFFKMKQE